MVALLEIQVPLVEQAVSGEAIPQAAVARRRHLGPIIAAATVMIILLVAGMVAVEPVLPQAEHWEEMAAYQAAVVVVVVDWAVAAKSVCGHIR